LKATIAAELKLLQGILIIHMRTVKLQMVQVIETSPQMFSNLTAKE